MKKKHEPFCEYFKSLRLENRITLRKFCEQAQADPGNISKMERGKIPPPEDEKILFRYAKAIKKKKDSKEWTTFIDLAAIDRGIIPSDIMWDEEVVEVLPIFFRTLRREKPTKKELAKLIERIRKS